MEAQVALIVTLRLSVMLGLVSIIVLSMGVQVRRVKHSNTMLSKPVTSSLALWQGQSPAGKGNQHVHKARRQMEPCSKISW